MFPTQTVIAVILFLLLDLLSNQLSSLPFELTVLNICMNSCVSSEWL